MRLLLSLLITMGMLSACTDLPVDTEVKSKGSATLLWSCPIPDATYLQVDPSSTYVLATIGRVKTDSILKINANTGAIVQAPELVGLSGYALSKDQQYIATAGDDRVVIIRRSDGRTLTEVMFEGPDWMPKRFCLSWNASSSLVYVWANIYGSSGLYAIPSTQGAQATQLIDVESIEGFDRWWRLGPLSGSNSMHVYRNGFWDADVQRLRYAHEVNLDDYRAVWPSNDAKHWFSLTDHQIKKVALTGKVIFTLPLLYPDQLIRYSLSDMVVSANDRYAAVLANDLSMSPIRQSMWIIDLRAGDHVCHIDVDHQATADLQFYFDPSNDRLLYVKDDNQVKKWSF